MAPVVEKTRKALPPEQTLAWLQPYLTNRWMGATDPSVKRCLSELLFELGWISYSQVTPADRVNCASYVGPVGDVPEI